MHDIEPYHEWRDLYVASEDENSPFYGVLYNEFQFHHKIYNYYIHPQWDQIGSPTLYMKLLFTDYESGFCIIELMGEWNDCINNDIMYLKREIVDHMLKRRVYKFIVLCDLVLNFHSDDDCYYEEWYEDVIENNGWIHFLNIRDHVSQEMNNTGIHNYVKMGAEYNEIQWRQYTPKNLLLLLEKHLN